MKTAHRKAAKHKRKWQKDPTAMGRVFARTQPYTQAEQAHLAIPAYDSLNRITSGQGEPKDIDILGTVINISLVLSEATHPECVNVCLDAALAAINAKERWKKMNRIGFDGPGLEAVRVVLDMYDQYLQTITPLQHQRAMVKVNERIANGQFLKESVE